MAACVICGIDDLENGYLTRTAAALAHRCGLPLVIAHVEAPPPTMPVPMLPGVPIERRGLDDSVLTEVRARLEDLARRESASATTLPLLGEPGSQLSRAAEAHDALSVVVGASCRSALGRLVMGSTAAWLCAHGRHPVVMVPRAGSEGGESVSLDGAGGTMLVGVDHESDAAVAIAGAMAERLALDCVLVHVLSVALRILELWDWRTSCWPRIAAAVRGSCNGRRCGCRIRSERSGGCWSGSPPSSLQRPRAKRAPRWYAWRPEVGVSSARRCSGQCLRICAAWRHDRCS